MKWTIAVIFAALTGLAHAGEPQECGALMSVSVHQPAKYTPACTSEKPRVDEVDWGTRVPMLLWLE